MKSLWTKWGGRRADVLDRSANAHTLVEGIRFGELYWTTPQLIAKYNHPLAYFFTHDHRTKDTNALDLYNKNPELLRGALQQIVETIDKDVTLSPGNTRSNALKLYEQFKIDFAIMCMGYDLFPFLTDKLKQELGEDEYKKRESSLNQPHKEPLLSQEHRELREVSALYHSGKLSDQGVKQKAAEFADKFGFVHSEYRGNPWNTDKYEKEIRSSDNADHSEKQQTPQNLTPLENIIRMCVYLLDQGKNAVVRTKWALRETVKNVGGDERQIMGLTETEFKKWVEDETVPDIDLAEREKYYVFIGKDKVSEYFGKDEVDRVLVREGITDFQDEEDDVSELKGTVAYPGRVEGRAHIVFSQEESEKVTEDDILISSMTTPELISGMRRAKAFVTDEGGMLTHAAIVAREMKKPCIVGTKKATRVFKNGDLIEVNAERGLIRKLK